MGENPVLLLGCFIRSRASSMPVVGFIERRFITPPTAVPSSVKDPFPPPGMLDWSYTRRLGDRL
jgi:hypothetical protein